MAAAHTERGALVNGLVQLARALGEPPRTYAILGEGNVSVRLDNATMLVKASGASLAAATTGSFVPVDLDRVMRLVREPPSGDAATAAALNATRAGDVSPARPSVETGLHAVLLTTTGARWVAHTHPTAITGILCSANAAALAAGALFPDQVVVCGPRPLLLPYVDPGIPLAQALLAALQEHIAAHGAPPTAIYLRNHGFVAIGHSAAEVLAITDMAVKAALVLAISFACGDPCYLPSEEAAHIAGRPDEHHRQRVLGLRVAEAEASGHGEVPP